MKKFLFIIGLFLILCTGCSLIPNRPMMSETEILNYMNDNFEDDFVIKDTVKSSLYIDVIFDCTLQNGDVIEVNTIYEYEYNSLGFCAYNPTFVSDYYSLKYSDYVISRKKDCIEKYFQEFNPIITWENNFRSYIDCHKHYNSKESFYEANKNHPNFSKTFNVAFPEDKKGLELNVIKAAYEYDHNCGDNELCGINIIFE